MARILFLVEMTLTYRHVKYNITPQPITPNTAAVFTELGFPTYIDVRLNMSHQETAHNIDQLFHALIEDVQQATVLWGDRFDGFSRRIYIKTVFSFFEGMIQLMKSSCLLFNKISNSISLTEEEIVLLKEEQAYIKGNGSVGIRNSNVNLASNILFTLQCCNKVFSLEHEHEQDVTGQGWQDFNSAIKIRNRITHPQSLEDLEISKEDMRLLNSAADYFRNETLPFIQNRKF